MAIASWPGDLPAIPLNNGFGGEFAENRLIWEPDVGLPYVRLRENLGFERQIIPMKMTKPQFQSFRTFYISTIAYGTLPFTYYDQVSEQIVDMMLDYKAGPPLWNKDMNVYAVTISVVILP